MKKILFTAMMLGILNSAYAEESFYCPSEIYCSNNPETKRLKCKIEGSEPNIWLEAINIPIPGAFSFSHIDYDTTHYGYSCVYRSGNWSNPIIISKIEYNLVPNLREESGWLKTKRKSGHNHGDGLDCGSTSSPMFTKDCPLKVDTSLLLLTDHRYLIALQIRQKRHSPYVVKRYYPDMRHAVNATRFNYRDAKQICENEKICKLGIIIYRVDKIIKDVSINDASIWVDVDNNMNIIDIAQPKHAPFQIIKLGSNSALIKMGRS